MPDHELMVNGKLKEDKPTVKTRKNQKNHLSLKGDDITCETILNLPVIVGYTCTWAGDQSCAGGHKVSRDFYCAPNASKAEDDPDDDDKLGDGDADMTVTAAPPPYDSHPFPVTPSSTFADDDDEES